MASKINSEHDKTYKVFLEDGYTFLGFLKGFVPEDWVNKINEKDLVLVNKSFILKDYKGREADIIYKAKINGKEVYLYILLELQSSVDYTMPYRLLIYMSEIWRRHFENEDKNLRKRKGFKLPAIIPMVLYTGEAKWTAARSFAEYQSGLEYYKEHLVDFKYILFDVRKYDSHKLEEIGTLIASVFLLERSLENKDEFLRQFRRIIGSGQKLTPEQWMKLQRWITSIWIQKVPIRDREEVIELIAKTKPMEVEKMVSILERKLDEWENEAKLKGMQEGIQKGVLNTARAVLRKGKTLEEVIYLLDLPEEVVKELREERANMQ